MNNLKDGNDDWSRWIENRVCVKGTMYGTLKYFGTTKFCDGLWCGVELDKPLGKNNGTVNNIQYFTCLPKFGLFVPADKVCKIENEPKNFNGTYIHLNGTFEVQNHQANTILLSNSINQSNNCHKEIEGINEVKGDKALLDSEESLGLLDPNLIDSLTTSWDALDIDTGVDGRNSPIFQDSIFKLDNKMSSFASAHSFTSNSLSTEKISNKISNPIYASTPRHTTFKKRFSDIAEVDLVLPNVNEHNDVFCNQMNFGEDVVFDAEKFINNPNLASTSELFQKPNTSPNATMNILSPIHCGHTTLTYIDLNKTQEVNPLLSMTNHEMLPMSQNLNKTQTFQSAATNADALNKTFKMPTKINCVETKDLNATVCLQIKEESENNPGSNQIGVFTDMSDKNIKLNSTFDMKLVNFASINVPSNVIVNSEPDLSQHAKADVCLSKALNQSFSPQINDESKNEILFQKTFVLDSSQFEERQSNEQVVSVDLLNNEDQAESFDYKDKFLEETVILEKSISNTASRNDVSIPAESLNSVECSQTVKSDHNSTLLRKSNMSSNISISSKNQRNMSNLQFKANNIDKKKIFEFKKPLSVCPSSRKSKALPKAIAVVKENSSCCKEKECFDKSNINIENSTDLLNMNLKQDKENRNFNSIKNESVLPIKNLVSDKNFEVNVDSVSAKSKRNRLSSSLDLDNKFNRKTKDTVKDRLSRRFSFSRSIASNELYNTTDNFQSKDKEVQSSKMHFKALPTNDLNVVSKVPLNSVKSTVSSKKTFKKHDSFEKKSLILPPEELIPKKKLPHSEQGLELFTKGCGIPGRSSLAGSSLAANLKTNLPVGIIKPRYSMLPTVKERNFIEYNSGNVVKQQTESRGKLALVKEAATTVSTCSTANSSKPRIASSLQPKSQIATRKTGQKYSDVKEGNEACLKIPRYNLRGKK